jgi:hypothetical protein
MKSDMAVALQKQEGSASKQSLKPQLAWRMAVPLRCWAAAQLALNSGEPLDEARWHSTGRLPKTPKVLQRLHHRDGEVRRRIQLQDHLIPSIGVGC